jgi:HD-GYP domain-containing protein (c-di-GMP phosphodiesterase class II)
MSYIPSQLHFDAAVRSAEWRALQAALEQRIASYHGDIGLKLAEHHKRVAADGYNFLKRLGYAPEICENINSALLIHDIGKTHNDFDPAIWTIDEAPSEEQRAEKRLHTRRGLEIFNEAVRGKDYENTSHVDLCRTVILYHHERLNGSAYENKTDLPPWLQVVGIIDTFDGDLIPRSHHHASRSPREVIERMMGKGSDKYSGAFDLDLLQKFAEYKL